MRSIISTLLLSTCLLLMANAQKLDFPEVKALTPFNNIKGIVVPVALRSARKLAVLYFSTQTQRTDTMSIKTFYQDGRLLELTLFESGHRKTTIKYTYHNRPGVNEEWQDEGIKGKNHNWLIVDTVFDKSGKVIETDGNEVTNKDTTSRVQYNFLYDKEGLLEEEDYKIDRRLLRVTNYYYQQGKIVKIRENSQLAGRIIDIEYTYDNNGSIIKMEKSYARETGKELIEFHNYTYTDNNILSCESFSYVGPTQKITNVKYRFNSDGTLGSMMLKKDTLYKNVQYQYSSNKLLGIHMVTNAPNDLFYGYYAMIPYNRKLHLPVSVDDKFIYDSRGNLVEKEQTSLTGLNRFSYVYEFY